MPRLSIVAGAVLKTFIVVIFLTFTFCITSLIAQDKVAEGQYEIRGGTPSAPISKTATRWVLYGKSSGGYQLKSEIQGQPAGMRVLQIEDLTDHFVPTLIEYELYRSNEQTPSITASCDLSAGTVVCTGRSGHDKAIPSPPYKFSGPSWIWMEGLFSLDIPWLLDGAMNMAHTEDAKINIATLVVSGGTGFMIGDAVNIANLQAIKTPAQTLTIVAPTKPISWGFRSPKESSLEFVARESQELNGTKIAVKHYSSSADKTKTAGVWITDSGFITKIIGDRNATHALVNYKQYKKLIPELPIEAVSSKAASEAPAAH